MLFPIKRGRPLLLDSVSLSQDNTVDLSWNVYLYVTSKNNLKNSPNSILSLTLNQLSYYRCDSGKASGRVFYESMAIGTQPSDASVKGNFVKSKFCVGCKL